MAKEAKKTLRKVYESLDPFELKERIEKGLKTIRAIRITQQSTTHEPLTTVRTGFGVFF